MLTMTKTKIDSLDNPYFLYRDKEHLEQEFNQAKNQLARHPSGTKIKNDRLINKKPDFSYSYIKINQKIYAISDEKIYETNRCTVKVGMDEEGFAYAIKIEKEHLANNRESKISIDMDLQDGLRALRQTAKGYKRYAAQNLLGSSSLYDYLEDTYEEPHTLRERLIERLTLARNLCAQVAALHMGEAAISETSYMHADIKPENIVVCDDDKTISLIDFGTAMPLHNLSSFNSLTGRTLAYLPYDDYKTEREEVRRQGMLKNMNLMNGQSIDLFAVLRTLVYPADLFFKKHDSRGIFTLEVYNQLPVELQTLLQTHFQGEKETREGMFIEKIQSLTQKHYTAKFFASIFAFLLKSIEKVKLPLKLEKGWLENLQFDLGKQGELLQNCMVSSPKLANKNQYADFSSLFEAVKNNSAEEVTQLINSGHNPNKPLMSSNSILMEAILRKKNQAAFALLSAKNIDVDYQNDSGKTAFFYAVASGNLAYLKKFREKKARLELADIHEITPLHIACLLSKADKKISALVNYNIPLAVSISTNDKPVKSLSREDNVVIKVKTKNAVNQVLNGQSFFKADIAYPNTFLFPYVRIRRAELRQEEIAKKQELMKEQEILKRKEALRQERALELESESSISSYQMSV